MKMFGVCLLGFFSMGLASMASAGDVGQEGKAEPTQHKCYLEEQRSSEYCQKVMFPPIPFR